MTPYKKCSTTSDALETTIFLRHKGADPATSSGENKRPQPLRESTKSFCKYCMVEYVTHVARPPISYYMEPRLIML